VRTSGWNRFPDTQILEPRSSQPGSGMATILSAKLKVKQAININFPAKRFKCSSPGGGKKGAGMVPKPIPQMQMQMQMKTLSIPLATVNEN